MDCPARRLGAGQRHHPRRLRDDVKSGGVPDISIRIVQENPTTTALYWPLIPIPLPPNARIRSEASQCRQHVPCWARIGGRGPMAQQVCVVVSAAERSRWLQSRATVIGRASMSNGRASCALWRIGSRGGAEHRRQPPKDPQVWQGADRVIDEPEEVGG